MEVQFLRDEGIAHLLSVSVYAGFFLNSDTSTIVYNFQQGVPIRLEIGPRDVTNKSVVISRRDIPGKQGKEFGVSMDPSILVDHIKGRLVEIQASLLQKAIAFRDRYYLFTLNDLS